MLALLRSIKPKNIECFYVRQAEALGLGHAVLCAERLVVDHPFAVILADDLLDGTVPIMRQMTQLYAEHGHSILGVEAIAPALSRSYGVIAGEPFAERLLKLNAIVEKPMPADAPSNLGVVGRYILTPAVFTHLRQLQPGAGGELQLTDAIAALLKVEPVLAYQFSGVRYDSGSKQGYLQATVEFALKHPEVAEEFRNYLQDVAQRQATTLKAVAG